MNRVSRLTVPGMVFALSGCTAGLYAPGIQDILSKESPESVDENFVLNQIKCELHVGVERALYDPNFYPPHHDATHDTGKSVDWLIKDKGWGAKVSYVLTVDEKGSLNPGLTFTSPFQKSGTSFSVGGGLSASSESQRKRTGTVTYAFSDLMKEPYIDHPCRGTDGILIYSELGISQFIWDEAFLTRVPGTIPNAPVSVDSSKPQILNASSEEYTFTVTFGANATPSWKFVRLNVNPTSPFLSDTRYKVQYVSVTLGPVATTSTNNTSAQLSAEAQTIDAANLTSHAIATSIRTSPFFLGAP
jgi:hypothetical protein